MTIQLNPPSAEALHLVEAAALAQERRWLTLAVEVAGVGLALVLLLLVL